MKKIIISTLLFLLFLNMAYAINLTSDNYKTEIFLVGISGNSTSTNYDSLLEAEGIAGKTKSNNYYVNVGFLNALFGDKYKPISRFSKLPPFIEKVNVDFVAVGFFFVCAGALGLFVRKKNREAEDGS